MNRDLLGVLYRQGVLLGVWLTLKAIFILLRGLAASHRRYGEVIALQLASIRLGTTRCWCVNLIIVLSEARIGGGGSPCRNWVAGGPM